MIASSRMDFQMLAKAEPIRSDSNTSVITEVVQKKFQPGKSGVRTWDNNTDTKVSAEGGGGTPWEQGKDSELRPLKPVEDHWGAETPCSLWRSPCWSRWMHEGGPCKAQDGAGSCRRPVAHGERNPCWSKFFPGLQISSSSENEEELSL
ncbi:hypothetical protein BTVI_71385 [Pitangus sulphuratus]|nr:hypothetical protein BTVI_71385 [Pitangus sulphuratus]